MSLSCEFLFGEVYKHEWCTGSSTLRGRRSAKRRRWAPCELGPISAQAQGEPGAKPPPRHLLQCRHSGHVLRRSKHCSYIPGVTWYSEILICKCSAQLVPLRKVNQPAHSKCPAREKITLPHSEVIAASVAHVADDAAKAWTMAISNRPQFTRQPTAALHRASATQCRVHPNSGQPCTSRPTCLFAGHNHEAIFLIWFHHSFIGRKCPLSIFYAWCTGSYR